MRDGCREGEGVGVHSYIAEKQNAILSTYDFIHMGILQHAVVDHRERTGTALLGGLEDKLHVSKRNEMLVVSGSH